MSCNCEYTYYCGDCEVCNLHKEGTFDTGFIDYEEGEKLAKEYFNNGKGKHILTVCYDCFSKITKGEVM